MLCAVGEEVAFIAIAIVSTPAALLDDRRDSQRPWLPLACGVLLLGAMTAFGFWRLAAMPAQFAQGVSLRIMQPNLQQDDKFNYSAKA